MAISRCCERGNKAHPNLSAILRSCDAVGARSPCGESAGPAAAASTRPPEVGGGAPATATVERLATAAAEGFRIYAPIWRERGDYRNAIFTDQRPSCSSVEVGPEARPAQRGPGSVWPMAAWFSRGTYVRAVLLFEALRQAQAAGFCPWPAGVCAERRNACCSKWAYPRSPTGAHAKSRAYPALSAKGRSAKDSAHTAAALADTSEVVSRPNIRMESSHHSRWGSVPTGPA